MITNNNNNNNNNMRITYPNVYWSFPRQYLFQIIFEASYSFHER